MQIFIDFVWAIHLLCGVFCSHLNRNVIENRNDQEKKQTREQRIKNRYNLGKRLK